jgi:DNA-binding beta-propeller fold protein YncE
MNPFHETDSMSVVDTTTDTILTTVTVQSVGAGVTVDPISHRVFLLPSVF